MKPTLLLEMHRKLQGVLAIHTDRVFARIEKENKKESVIINPQEYATIFSNYGTVVPLTSDGINRDWKDVVGSVVRPPGQWKFQFNPCKGFMFKRSKNDRNVLIKGEVNYKTDLMQNYTNVCKKSKDFKAINHPSRDHLTRNTCGSFKTTRCVQLVIKTFW
ncbi:hypothetical protein QE152_g38438 [Popillia japonica]|uniref:Uncharacterized protein n=1 Tax=Popillia japonica TaxID=7064 RepID=A0AAW1HWP1_POPJA